MIFSRWLSVRWWTYPDSGRTCWDFAYHWFNLIEGAVWLAIAGCVLARWIRFRRATRLELPYATAFVAFALSDFHEAYEIHAGLLIAKALVLAALLWLRRELLQRDYAGCNRLFSKKLQEFGNIPGLLVRRWSRGGRRR